MSDELDAPSRVASGTTWAAVTQMLTKGTTILATLVLARVLLPEDFGLFAIGILFINYLDRIKDLGVGAALVYRPEPWSRLAGTGFTLAVLSSGFLALVAFLAAPVAADYFRDPRVTDLVRVLAIVLLTGGLAIVPEARMRRMLDFRRRCVPETAAAVVKGLVSVSLAVAGLGVWSLVWGQFAGVLVQVALYWWMAASRPIWGWDPPMVQALLAYGVPISLVALFSVFQENVDYLVIGRRLDTEQLGYYAMAYRIPELTVLMICLTASQVLFPMLARLQDDMKALSEAYLSAVPLITCFTVGTATLLAVLAPETVDILYGDGWEPTVDVLRLIALFMLVYSLGFHAGDVYKATGRPGILNWFAVLKIGFLAPTLWWLAPRGIVAVALGMVVTHIVIGIAELVVAGRILRLSARRLGAAFVPALLGGAVMAVVCLPLQAVLTTLPAAIRLVVVGLVGTASFVYVVRLVSREVYELAHDHVLSIMRRRSYGRRS